MLEQISKRIRRRRGAIILQAALLLVVVLCFAAFSIDVGFISTVRTEMQRSADAGALAGVSLIIGRPDDVGTEARTYCKNDNCGGRTLIDSEINVEMGRWDDDSRSFSPGSNPFDAVRVTASRGDVPSFFAGICGYNEFQIQASAIATFEPRDIMLVLDLSGSMNDEDKVGALKEAVRVFTEFLENTTNEDKVGYVRYSDNGDLKRSLTGNLSKIRKEVLSETAEGWTNIGEGMQLGRRELQNNGRRGVKKLMVLMTDGIANRPEGRDPFEYVISEANAALTQKIPIVAISFGSLADERLMQQVADITGSTHFHVSGWNSSLEDELTKVFRTVAASRPVKLVD